MIQIIRFRIVAQAIRFFEFDIVNQHCSGGEEKDFEDGVIKRDVIEEEVHVSGTEDHKVDFLGSVT